MTLYSASANGMPGIHHVMARSIKDIFCRYKTMKGFLVKRKAGWDTHGLPVELGVEKAMGITKEDIGKTISVADYNAACRKDVMKFTKEWEDLTHKMGYWIVSFLKKGSSLWIHLRLICLIKMLTVSFRHGSVTVSIDRMKIVIDCFRLFLAWVSGGLLSLNTAPCYRVLRD